MRRKFNESVDQSLHIARAISLLFDSKNTKIQFYDELFGKEVIGKEIVPDDYEADESIIKNLGISIKKV